LTGTGRRVEQVAVSADHHRVAALVPSAFTSSASYRPQWDAERVEPRGSFDLGSLVGHFFDVGFPRRTLDAMRLVRIGRRSGTPVQSADHQTAGCG
jgi:hypothetical protein